MLLILLRIARDEDADNNTWVTVMLGVYEIGLV